MRVRQPMILACLLVGIAVSIRATARAPAPAAARAPAAPASPATPPAGFVVPEGLEVSVWAKTPQLANPTNIDVDARGRIWVTEAVNYRGRQKGGMTRAGGDRVVILEDTDNDGTCDSSKTFVEDPDLVAPLGIAVIRDKVYVSCSPSVIVYTVGPDDKPVKKEVWLTGFGGRDHDHGLHSLVGGPDGAFYLNAGNAGPHVVTDKSGWTLRSGSAYDYVGVGAMQGVPSKNRGNQKSDDGRVWTGGVLLRLNPDATGMRPIAHNFRNSYETAIDSFGDCWQNDNDDEVQACRTSWVMPGGNMGYASADGLRTWRADQRPGQSIPIAHWHQEDPGVCPPGDITGAGAPTGVVVYEGNLLGEKFKGMVLNADAGRNVVFGHVPHVQGAGFTLEQTVFLSSVNESTENYVWNKFLQDERRWFRPSDVAVGTDGSVFVSDWFDPIVGGHDMREKQGFGRILRVAPKGHKPSPPRIELTTTEGQIQALRNPAIHVRYLGQQKLREQGVKAFPALKKLMDDPEPVVRARALWLIGAAGEKEGEWIEETLRKEKDPRVWLVAFRSLRASGLDMLRVAGVLKHEATPALEREYLVWQRDVPLERNRHLLAELAARYDGKDRYYLEALGVGCEGKEEAVYQELLAAFGADAVKWPAPMADIAWRLHPPASVPHLLARAKSSELPLARRKQAVDGLAFVKHADAAAAMVQLATDGPADVRETAAWWVTFRRTNEWKEYDAALALMPSSAERPAEPAFASPVITGGTTAKIDVDITGAKVLWLVVNEGKNGLSCDWADWMEPRLVGPKGELKLTDLKWKSAAAGFGDVNVNANCRGRPLRVGGKPVPFGIGTHSNSEIVYELPAGYTRFVAEGGIDNGGADGGTDFPGGKPDVQFLVFVDAGAARARAAVLRDVMLNTGKSREERENAAAELAKTKEGGAVLVSLTTEGKLPEDLKPVVAEHIFRNPDLSVRAVASQHFPRAGAGKPLPPIAELVKLGGDARKGRDVFFGQKANCAQCHTFGGKGADIGPDLSQIRTKYDRTALLDSILNPSAGILLGYEPWVIETKDGQTHFGFVLSEGDVVMLKDTGGRKVTLKSDQIVKRKRQNLSVMPDNVAAGLEPQELADLVQFLMAAADARP